MKKKKNDPPEKPVNRGRHEFCCKVCNHPERAEIEAEFLSWKNPALICRERGIADRASIYRHAHATGLMEKRRRNVRAVLESLCERAGEVIEINGSVIVQAVTALARINSSGHLVERRETVNLNELFEKMSREELLAYAESGTLPSWCTSVVGATGDDGQEVIN